ncbi:hypothetical protein V8C37DRAFT_390202 [Trichoderma ceciliae]
MPQGPSRAFFQEITARDRLTIGNRNHQALSLLRRLVRRAGRRIVSRRPSFVRALSKLYLHH